MENLRGVQELVSEAYQPLDSALGIGHYLLGYWTKLLGIGDFYYELAVQIVEACLSNRTFNGGLMDILALHKYQINEHPFPVFINRYVQHQRGSTADPISVDDLKVAINKIKALGHGFQLVTVGGQTLVKSVPRELNTDKSAILELAQKTGYVSKPQLQSAGWTDHRIDQNLEVRHPNQDSKSLLMKELMKDELAMIDDGSPDGVRLYWFPCVKDVAV